MTKTITFLCLGAIVLQAQDITNKLGGSTATETYDVIDSADNVLFRVQGDGNVGIGTDTPDELLQIDGNMRLDGSFEDKDGEAGTSGQILSSTGTGTDWIGSPSGGLYNAYVKVSDRKSQSTAGGTFTSGDWRTRDINTEDDDPQSIASISSNQITLPAGTYRCNIICPAVNTNSHQARLRNITGNTTLIVGTSSYCANSAGHASTNSSIVGRFSLTVESILEIQHRANATSTVIGFGMYSGFDEMSVYTVAEFWREN